MQCCGCGAGGAAEPPRAGEGAGAWARLGAWQGAAHSCLQPGGPEGAGAVPSRLGGGGGTEGDVTPPPRPLCCSPPPYDAVRWVTKCHRDTPWGRQAQCHPTLGRPEAAGSGWFCPPHVLQGPHLTWGVMQGQGTRMDRAGHTPQGVHRRPPALPQFPTTPPGVRRGAVAQPGPGLITHRRQWGGAVGALCLLRIKCTAQHGGAGGTDTPPCHAGSPAGGRRGGQGGGEKGGEGMGTGEHTGPGAPGGVVGS